MNRSPRPPLPISLVVPLLPLFPQPIVRFLDYYVVLVLGQFACEGLGQLISLLVAPNKAALAGVVAGIMLNLIGGFNPTLSELDDMGVLGTAAYSVSYAR